MTGTAGPSIHPEAEVLEALLASVDRAIPRDDAPGDALADRARELGLFELGGLDPAWSEGDMEWYARALTALAHRHGPLARLVAARNAPPDAEGAPFEAIARRKARIDAMAILAGRTAAAVELAGRFAAERTLFRRRLVDVPAVEVALARACDTAARLRAGLMVLSRPGEAAPDAARRACALACKALETVSEMVQLMGGTGLMEESRMPALYREVLAAVAELGLATRDGAAEGCLCDHLLAAPGTGGVPLDH